MTGSPRKNDYDFGIGSTKKFRVDGSNETKTCKCFGLKNVLCSTCIGSGKNRCYSCGGRGDKDCSSVMVAKTLLQLLWKRNNVFYDYRLERNILKGAQAVQEEGIIHVQIVEGLAGKMYEV